MANTPTNITKSAVTTSAIQGVLFMPIKYIGLALYLGLGIASAQTTATIPGTVWELVI